MLVSSHVAQLVEQAAVNRPVSGSNPLVGAKAEVGELVQPVIQ